jgi:5'-nucleotidase
VVLALLERLPPAKIPPATILNVNVPDRPYEQLRGVQATRLGHRHKAEPVVRAEDPRGLPIFWVGPPGSEQDAGPGTDFHAVREGFVSVTPIAVDLTRHDALPVTEAWVARVRL